MSVGLSDGKRIFSNRDGPSASVNASPEPESVWRGTWACPRLTELSWWDQHGSWVVVVQGGGLSFPGTPEKAAKSHGSVL